MDAKRLKEDSDEKRLQPFYIRLFFEKAFKNLNGKYTEIRKSIFQIDEIPEPIIQVLKDDYNISADIKQIKFCFDKQVFLDYQNLSDLGRVHYINPGNPVFDSLVKVVRNEYKEDMLKGSILVSPDDKTDYFAFFVKSQISDNRPHKEGESIADEKLLFVHSSGETFHATSPAKFIDLHAPSVFAKEITPPEIISNEEVTNWCFENITMQQFEDTKVHVQNDANTRKQYLQEAFNSIIMDLLAEINELQGKILLGEQKVEDKIQRKQERIEELKRKRVERLQKLELMQQLSMKPPQVLGCAYVVPLTQVEYSSHYGMKRDDEVEEIALKIAMDFEQNNGWNPVDVSDDNTGYDIKSISSEGLKKYIEVKGRSADGGVMLSENEMNRLAQLEDSAWLYIVINCKSIPSLHRIQNPANNLKFELKSKGVQYYLSMEEWKNKSN